MTPGSRLAPLSRAAAQWAFGRPGVYAVPRALPFLGLGSTHYREPGRVAGMPETAAMMLASCWDAADGEAERRSRNAIEYARRLCVAGLQPVAVVEGGRSGYLRYPVLASRALPESLVNRTTRSGVSGGYPVPLPLVAPRPSDHAADRLEGAAALASRLITLPTHGLLRSVDMDRAAAVATAVEAGGSP
jgi:dTDP-4-amino-4,6-dideoxygalactose transaminase